MTYNQMLNAPDPSLSEEMRFLVVQIKEQIGRINDPDLNTDVFLQRMVDQMLDLMDRARLNEIASAQMTNLLSQIRMIMKTHRAPYNGQAILQVMNDAKMAGLAA
jgi:hypothetical protein